ncbi:MAG: FAD-dependent oxidoreductase [Planctomycetota bacterium]
MPAADRKQLVLVGGGHSHVQVLRSFGAAPPPQTDVTVVVDDPVAMYSGMAPGFVAGQYERAELEIDVRPLAAICGAPVIVSRCVRVDAGARRLELADGTSVTYDVASFNIGSTVVGLDLPGVREHALPTRPLRRLVDGVASLVELARRVGRSRPLRVVVVGGGSGGVELALTLQHRLAEASGRAIDVTLLDGGPRILARYPDSLVRRVERLCARRGIAVRNQARVTAVSAIGVTLADASELPCDATIWVTGPTGHDLFVASDLPTDGRGFVRIRSTLQVEGRDELFAVGDCGTLIEHPHTPKAGVYAVRMGPVVTENIRARLAGHPLQRYRPQHDFLTLLNAGDGTALGAKWGIAFGGRWVMRLKDRIDRAFMRTYQLRSR